MAPKLQMGRFNAPEDFQYQTGEVDARRCPICLLDLNSNSKMKKHKSSCHRYARSRPAAVPALPPLDNILVVLSHRPGTDQYLCELRNGEREWMPLPADHALRVQFERSTFPDVRDMSAWANGIEIVADSGDDST
eukprot:701713_1